MTKKLNRVPIDQYQRDKKVLKPILHMINDQVYFEKNLLPEFLWLAYLTDSFGEVSAHKKLGELSEIIDQYYTPDTNSFFKGTISSFELIPKSNRNEFLDDNIIVVEELIIKPFGPVIALYPNCPMSWINASYEGKPDKKVLEALEDVVSKLQDSKSDYTGNIRAMPFNQILKHNKVHFNSTMKDSIKAFEEYPYGDRYRAQTIARTIFNIIENQKSPDRSWSKHFWDSNFKLINCNE